METASWERREPKPLLFGAQMGLPRALETPSTAPTLFTVCTHSVSGQVLDSWVPCCLTPSCPQGVYSRLGEKDGSGGAHGMVASALAGNRGAQHVWGGS